MRWQSFALIALLAFGSRVAAQSRFNLEIRGGDGRFLKGYLLIREPPPDLDLLTIGDNAPEAYYRYFTSFDDRVYSLRGSASLLLSTGVLSIAPEDIRDSRGKPWSSGRLAYVFYFWSDDPQSLDDSGSLMDRLERCRHVTWWTANIGEKEAAAGLEVRQYVTVRDSGRWTEAHSFYGDGAGSGYFPTLREHQSFVLEPPLDREGKTIIATLFRPPILLVHGINGTAAEWEQGAERPAPYELREARYPVWELQYGMGQENLIDSGQMLYEAVQQVLRVTPNVSKVDMVTHSYGGVVARRMLHAVPDSRLRIRRLLMVSPPHHGSFSAFRVARYSWKDALVVLQRMGFKSDSYLDPNAPIYRDLSPGSAALLDLESSPEAFSLFTSGDDPEARVFVLTGDKTDFWPEVFNDEAPGHDDGVVSISSASLRDLGLPLGTIGLTHRQETTSARLLEVIRQLLEGPDHLRSLEGVNFDSPCQDPPRGGVTVDARGFGGCPGGIANVRLSFQGSKTAYETAATRNPSHDSYFLYDSNDFKYSYRSPAGVPTNLAPGLAFPLDSLDENAATLIVGCNGGTELSYPVKLLGCRTNTIRLDRILGPAARKVTVVRTGRGAITSSPAGIQCGASCSAEFFDAAVTLTAAPAGSFLGWGGACQGRDPVCRLPSASATVIATFDGAGAPAPVTDLGAGVTMEFVPLQPGQFMMGCSPDDSQCESNEKPAHRVLITKGFQMGKFEVTQAQWQRVMGTNPSHFKDPAAPVETVGWNEAQDFLARLNARNDGYRYRLPTEAEWEYAARAGATDKHAGGIPGESAWYGANSGGQTHPAGTKRPNAWGLFDMLGNVWEWCQDWHSGYPSGDANDPTGPPTGSERIIRGGTFGHDAWGMRVSLRGASPPHFADDESGFRCVREPLAATATVGLQSLTLSASSVVGGNTVGGTITLVGAPQADGTRVLLTSDNPNATVPASVTVPAGLREASAQFTVATRPVSAAESAVITASLGNDKKTVQLTLTPVGTGTSGPFGMEFVNLPPGEFRMGCSAGDTQCASNESPARQVRITRAPQMGKFEVTQAQWQAVMGSNPSVFRGAELPVTDVSWNDVQVFLHRLNARLDGFRYRLPTEAEWEYAARAGTADRYPRAQALGDVAWYLDNSIRPNPVGKKNPNAWGLYDMLGNVGEWCLDFLGTYSANPETDPTGPSSGGTARVIRGGSYWDSSYYLRFSHRFRRNPDDSNFDIGFRCVREQTGVPPVAPTLGSMVLSNASAKGGTPVTGTVTLEAPAPAGGVTVILQSDSSVASVPASVVIGPGQSSAQFTVTTIPIAVTLDATIRATVLGDTRTVVLTIN